MTNHQLRSKRRLFFFIFIPVTIVIILGLTCCYGGYSLLHPRETRAPEQYPDTDLVFLGKNSIGFVNDDGSNAVYIPITIHDYWDRIGIIWRPVITGDNQTLIMKVGYNYYYAHTIDYLAIWQVGEYPLICAQWGQQLLPLLASDQKHIFIQSERGLSLYALDSCGMNSQPEEVYEGIHGIPSPDMRYVAYTVSRQDSFEDPSLVILELASHTEHAVIAGDFPSWSFDSKRLAYVGKDGIYIYNVTEDTPPYMVVDYKNPVRDTDPAYSEVNGFPPPEVSWSPDGEWLVYHKWDEPGNYTQAYPDRFAVFKLNLETGEETKIIADGMYPYWRWPAQP